MATAANLPVRMFLSYARQDRELVQELKNHLTSLLLSGRLSVWGEREIQPGVDWAQVADARLDTADLVLLLVSADLLGSGYATGSEIMQVLERHRERKVSFIPLILRPVDWGDLPFASLQVVPRNARPVTAWESRDAAWYDVIQAIRRIVQMLQEKSR